MTRKFMLLVMALFPLIMSCSKSTKPTPPQPPAERVWLVEGWADWSPDGRYIAYTRPPRTWDEYMRWGSASIWVYDMTTQHFGLVICPGEFPRWSPDGSILAFIWGGIIFYYPESGMVRHITPPLEVIAGFDWSPDGTRLLLGNGDGMIIDTSGNELRHLFPWDGSNGGWRGAGVGEWSRLGGHILIPTETTTNISGILVVDTLGNIIDTVTMGQRSQQGFEYAAWSPDESNIAVNYVDEVDNHDYNDLRIYTINGDLGRILSLDAGMADWSPDGSKIVFQKYTFMGHTPAPMIEPDYGRTTVWVSNADGSDMYELLGWPQTGHDSTMFDGGYNWANGTHAP